MKSFSGPQFDFYEELVLMDAKLFEDIVQFGGSALVSFIFLSSATSAICRMGYLMDVSLSYPS